MRAELKCQNCWINFYPKSGHLKQKTCWNKCKYELISKNCNKKKGRKYPHLQKAKEKKCPICKKTFRAINDSINHKQKYCSRDCWNIRATKINICICWKEIKTFDSVDKKYCCKKCYSEDLKIRMKWKNSYFWKWWKTKESKLRKTCAEYKEWRLKVFTRDWFKCILCNSKKQLEADHIKAQSEYPELIYDLDNWRTLCHNCHKETDNYWWKQQAKMKNTYK